MVKLVYRLKIGFVSELGLMMRVNRARDYCSYFQMNAYFLTICFIHTDMKVCVDCLKAWRHICFTSHQTYVLCFLYTNTSRTCLCFIPTRINWLTTCCLAASMRKMTSLWITASDWTKTCQDNNRKEYDRLINWKTCVFVCVCVCVYCCMQK